MAGQTKKEDLLRRIEDDIVKRNLEANDRLVEKDLCERYSVGRSYIREALMQLAYDGVVKITPHRGAVVQDVSAKDVAQIYDILGVLEGLAFRGAIIKASDKDIDFSMAFVTEMEKCDSDAEQFSKLNNDFHAFFTGLSGNDRLVRITERLRLSPGTIRLSIYGFRNREQVQASVDEHREIISTLRRRDSVGIEALIKKHYSGAKERLINLIHGTIKY